MFLFLAILIPTTSERLDKRRARPLATKSRIRLTGSMQLLVTTRTKYIVQEMEGVKKSKGKTGNELSSPIPNRRVPFSRIPLYSLVTIQPPLHPLTVRESHALFQQHHIANKHPNPPS